MDQGLNGKRVLVTGGTRGIGRATVLAFARVGAKVITCHRHPGHDADSLALELKSLGEGHQVIRADVTSGDDVAALMATIRASHGGLDVLVNNAGVDGVAPFDRLAPDEWRRVVEHNLTGPYLVTQAALGLLADGASVVVIGSAAALRGRPMAVHYSASKTALIGFTRALSRELGPRGIRVNLVAPGLTVDDSGEKPPPQVLERIVAMTALGRPCRPEDIAGAVLFLAGDTSRCVTGITLNVDGGM